MLGREVSLEGDDVDDVRGAGVVTAVTPEAGRAASVLARVVPELGTINERGEVQPPRSELPEAVQPLYTPNYVFPLQWCQHAVVVILDTKGVMWSAMGRTMVKILVDALAEEALPAHITGARDDLRAELSEWEEPLGGGPATE